MSLLKIWVKHKKAHLKGEFRLVFSVSCIFLVAIKSIVKELLVVELRLKYIHNVRFKLVCCVEVPIVAKL